MDTSRTRIQVEQVSGLKLARETNQIHQLHELGSRGRAVHVTSRRVTHGNACPCMSVLNIRQTRPPKGKNGKKQACFSGLERMHHFLTPRDHACCSHRLNDT